MTHGMPASRPDWVSDELFPCESKFFTTPSGHAMHFVAEEAPEQVLPVLSSFMKRT